MRGLVWQGAGGRGQGLIRGCLLCPRWCINCEIGQDGDDDDHLFSGSNHIQIVPYRGAPMELHGQEITTSKIYIHNQRQCTITQLCHYRIPTLKQVIR